MDLKYFGVIFTAVFIAELGDKTQLATMLFASDKEVSRWLVFLPHRQRLSQRRQLGS